MSGEDNKPSKSGESQQSWEEQNPEIEREVTIDEYQPKGTLTVTLIYFGIMVLMWIFMYFVEFAGNAPSIIE